VKCECTGDGWLKADGKACAHISTPVRFPQALVSSLRCQPQIAFDAAGNALAVWIRATDQGSALWSARFVNGAGWSQASQLPFVAAASIDTPVLALAPMGAGLVLWIQSAQPHLELHGSAFDGTSFAAPVLVGSGDAGDIQYPTLTLAPNGDGLAM
jgi:hypothetical protein